MIRLFSALQVRDDLKNQLSSCVSTINGVRWVQPESYHSTVLFFGDVNVYLFRQIKQQLRNVEFKHASSKVIGLELFYDKKGTPNVLTAKIEYCKAFHKLYSDSLQLIRMFYPDLKIDYDFKPHITLARLNNPDMNLLSGLIDYHKESEFGTIESDCVNLYSSRLTSEGSMYSSMETYYAVDENQKMNIFQNRSQLND